MREILNKLFPKDEEQRRSSKFVERGLEALRMVRDEHAVVMGNSRRAPSHFELRVSPQQYDALRGMDAIRDMAFFFKDELMKDLAAEKMRTFGDHTIRVGIASDPALGSNEIYAVVLNPERPARTPEGSSGRGAGGPAPGKPKPADDATRVLGWEPEPEAEESGAGQAPTIAFATPAPQKPEWILRVHFPDGTIREERLDSDRWIVGRRGSTGSFPPGFRKLDLDLPTTISREQLALELDDDTLLIKRIGKGGVGFRDGAVLNEGESRRLEMGMPFYIDGIEMKIEAIQRSE